jgi:type IV pilus assembly protein PilW
MNTTVMIAADRAHGTASLVARRRAPGFTIVELMIAITIALFLSAGLLTLVQAMKATGGIQSGLSQLQDSERTAMTLIADVIQSAGYFPQPTVNVAAGEFPVGGPFVYAGQSVAGGAANGFDAITVRYATAGTNGGAPPGSAPPDNIINCTGNFSQIPTMFTNTFSLQPDPSVAGTFDLMCNVVDSAGNNNTVQLVAGITAMSVLYGVQTNPASGTNGADTYLSAADVTNGSYWPNVVSVKVTVTFVNPLYGNLAGQNTNLTTPQTIPFTRVVAVMNKNGVTT